MNYIEIMGGLGNQLFQYAFAKYIENLTGVQSTLYISFFDNLDNRPDIVKREFSIQNFNFDFETAKGRLTVSKIHREYESFTVYPGDNNIFFSGFWQDKRFCEDNLDDWKKIFGLNSTIVPDDNFLRIAEEISSSNSIALHVRRGDYLDEENVRKYGDITPEYYKKGLSEIIAKEDCNHNTTLYVFSDDIDYCMGFIRDIWQNRLVFMPMRKDYEDMYLMTKARHHIIANSTFSWWGAALSSRDGITVAPTDWYRKRDSQKLYLDNWLII